MLWYEDTCPPATRLKAPRRTIDLEKIWPCRDSWNKPTVHGDQEGESKETFTRDWDCWSKVCDSRQETYYIQSMFGKRISLTWQLEFALKRRV